jgi:diguanylate cyclase (GGDEF)-like protein
MRLITIAALAVALMTMMTGAIGFWQGWGVAHTAVISGMCAAALALVIPILLRPRLLRTLGSLHNDMIDAASRDTLSGLDNRATLLMRAEGVLRSAQRSGRRFALLFIDGDDFKRINDRHGHAVGDAVIAEVAQRIRGLLRAGDVAARMGGDEFVILIAEVNGRDDALSVVQRLKQAMTASVVLSSGETLMVGLSIGAAMYPDDGTDVATLIAQADAAMYADKVASRA